jgi:hypothetical protein
VLGAILSANTDDRRWLIIRRIDLPVMIRCPRLGDHFSDGPSPSRCGDLQVLRGRRFQPRDLPGVTRILPRPRLQVRSMTWSAV